MLYDDESVIIISRRRKWRNDHNREEKLNEIKNATGKFGRLNEMTGMDSEAERKKAMLEFEEEEQMADQIFKIY